MSKNIEHQYLNLLQDILDNGVEKQDRTCTGTISVFGRQIRHNMSEGFPLLTTKKMYWKGIVTELLWFLRGDTNIKYLVDNDCHIWNGDAYKKYCKNWGGQNKYSVKTPILEDGVVIGSSNRKFTQEEFIDKIKTDDEFAEKWGDLGPIYGKQWRSWKTEQFDYKPVAGHPNRMSASNFRYVDQIQNLINNIKSNPDSRRLMVNAWNVGELDNMTLPPCHYGFQVYTRELRLIERINIAIERGLTTKTAHMSEENYWDWCDKKSIPTRAISLMFNMRSVDTFLGLPFNIASYGLLLEIIAKEVNMIPDELIGNLGDVHLYKNHIEQAKEQMTREPMKLPTLCDLPNGNWESFTPVNFDLKGYSHHKTIKAPLNN